MSIVFTEVKFNNLKAKNRIVRSATNDYMSNSDGTVSDSQIELYEELAKNNIGMIISGHLFVSEKYAQANKGQMGICDDKHIEGQKRITGVCKSYGATIVAQINHAGGKGRVADKCYAPSAIPAIDGQDIVPETLTLDQINVIKQEYIDGAVRAKKAGYDGVQVHCAHGYLLSEFIDPNYNTRDDIYGGSAPNRFRLAKEIIIGIKKACGEDYPVLIKLNSTVKEQDEEYKDDLIYIIKECEAIGVEAVELSGHLVTYKTLDKKLYFLERAEYIMSKTDMPIILVGGIRTFEDMETALNKGVKMVSLSRPLICQPDAITRLLNGEQLKCVYCSGCFTIYHKAQKRCVLH